MISVDGRKIPAEPRFRSGHRPIEGPELPVARRAAGRASWPRNCSASRPAWPRLEDKPYTTRPYPPFTTSTLQQEANRKYGFTARRTMQVAQSLYENGHITYMRTDSTNLATVAIEAARQIGRLRNTARNICPTRRGIYQTKVKNAQEAHEAIRPAGHPFDFPEGLRGRSEPRRVQALRPDLEADGRQPDGRRPRPADHDHASRRRRRLPGQRQDDRVSRLPAGVRRRLGRSRGRAGRPRGRAAAGRRRRVAAMPRTGAEEPHHPAAQSLQRSLAHPGVGRDGHRPAEHLRLDHRHDPGPRLRLQVKRGNVLVPTWTAFAVSQLLETHLPDLVDYQFTAEMEDELDAISRGEIDHLEYLRHFYFGKDDQGLKQLVTTRSGEIDARDVCRMRIGQPEGPSRRSSSASAATGRSSNRATAGRAFPTKRRPTN